MAAAAKYVRSQAAFAERQPQHQAAGGFINEVTVGVLRVDFSFNAQIAHEEETSAAAQSQASIFVDSTSIKVIQVMLAERTPAKEVDGELLIAIEPHGIVVIDGGIVVVDGRVVVRVLSLQAGADAEHQDGSRNDSSLF